MCNIELISHDIIVLTQSDIIYILSYLQLALVNAEEVVDYKTFLFDGVSFFRVFMIQMQRKQT